MKIVKHLRLPRAPHWAGRAQSWLLSLGLPLFLAVAPTMEISPDSHRQTTALAYEPCYMENDTFQAGETITYKIYYNWNFVWLSAGEVTFRVYDEGDEYHLAVRGSTYSSYEWFFTVRDNYDTYISKENLLPRLSIRDIHEGNYTRYERVTFDQGNRRAESIRGRTRTEVDTQRINLSGCMHDLLSIVYYLRNVEFDNLQAGHTIPITFYLDREQYPIKVSYLGQESSTRVKGMGRYRTHKFSPELIAGEVFKEGDEMTVWVSDDRNRIPVLIESPVSVGSVKVVLKSYNGLKYDFTAKQ
ncbi:MAG: DUF3108 domain-containing protein [Lewinella sp.]|nr:DUF3108 domain-containing protein [Lewinella sp.]